MKSPLCPAGNVHKITHCMRHSWRQGCAACLQVDMIEKVPSHVHSALQELRALRYRLGISAPELDAMLGMPKLRINRYEIGDVAPTPQLLMAIEELLERWREKPPASKRTKAPRPARRVNEVRSKKHSSR